MAIKVFNLNDSVDEILQTLINSDDQEILLYYEGRSDDISSIELPDLCEFYFELFNAINKLPDHQVSVILSKLHQQTIGEMFMCDVAHRIYADINISPQVEASLRIMELDKTGKMIYDVIWGVKQSL